MKSPFWEYVDSAIESVQELDKLDAPRADSLLVEACPAAAVWKVWEREEKRHLPPGTVLLLRPLLFTLRWGDIKQGSPKVESYRPEDVLLLHEDQFKEIIFQGPPRGCIPFIWTMSNHQDYPCGSISQGHHDSRWVGLIEGRYYVLSKRVGEPDWWVTDFFGACIGYIQGPRVVVYPFPSNWLEVVERVKDKIGHMNAEEKARIELPHELQAFVNLLGWDEVNRALEALHPS